MASHNFSANWQKEHSWSVKELTCVLKEHIRSHKEKTGNFKEYMGSHKERTNAFKEQASIRKEFAIIQIILSADKAVLKFYFLWQLKEQ